METSPSALAKILVPKAPLLIKTALWHTLWLSHTSSKWDLKTELTITVLRDMLGGGAKPTPVTKQQYMTCKDPGVKGKIWVSRAEYPVPEEDDLRQLLFKAIDDMKEGDEAYTKPESKPLEGEWHGYRAEADKDAPEPSTSEEEKYSNLMKEVKNDVTLLYFHGGAYVLLDPATYRNITSLLAKTTGGRVFAVRYRLAPQNPFPAALLDALTSYLSLLYPPPGGVHEPVPASKIVFGGDSAGGNLSAVLLQTILQLHRTASAGQLPRVQFHGKEVEIPLPAGVALNSPWFDITRSLPSLENNAKFDYLPPPSASAADKYPHDEAWPANPPRKDMYCETSALCHPLVSPLAAKDWSNAPPMYIGCGEEMLADEDIVIAQRIVRQGGTVIFEQYEAMPHVFSYMLQGNETSRLFISRYTDFIRHAVEKPAELRTKGTYFTAKSLAEHKLDMTKLTDITDEQVVEHMKKAQEKKEEGKDNEAKAMPRL